MEYTAADPADNQSFHMWLDGERRPSQDGIVFDADNAQYRNLTYPIGVRKPWDIDNLLEHANGPRSLFWTDETTLANSKFFTGFAPTRLTENWDEHLWGLFSESMDAAQTFIQPELDNILELWNDSREGPNANPIPKSP